MMQYEAVLNKIAPMFYKLIQYREYFDKFNNVIPFYLLHVENNVYELPPAVYRLMLPAKDIYYYIIVNISPIFINGEKVSDKKILLITRDKMPTIYDNEVYLDELIVNLIANNFSFENTDLILKGWGIYVDYTYKKFFILLVGKDLYDAIRSNIK
jgi:hypothetical protein